MAILATKKAIADLAFRLGELSMEVQSLKSAHKHLELEWEELYDKVRHQMARMSRRAKADAKINGGEIPEEVVTETETGIDPISARILDRRNRGRHQP